MAEEAGSLLGPKAIEQMAKIARENARRMMNERPHRARWQGSRGGGSGPPRIRFTILSTSFTVGLGALGCDHVTVLVNHISCRSTGVNVGDEVDVYDPEYCHFNLPIELLVGLSGTATLMDADSYQEGLDYALECLEELREAGCIWMVDNLFCAEEELIGD